MGGTTMAFLIVAIALTAGVINNWLKTKRIEAENKTPSDDYAQKLEELEERVKILERIHTDPGERLKREFEDL